MDFFRRLIRIWQGNDRRADFTCGTVEQALAGNSFKHRPADVLNGKIEVLSGQIPTGCKHFFKRARNARIDRAYGSA